MSNATGAKPGERATRTQHSYPIGPEFAAYKLPFAGTRGIDPREVGIWFEGEAGAGDDSGAAGAGTGAGGDAGGGTGAAGASAKDGEELGDAGREAIRRERENAKTEKQRADAAEARIVELEAAGQSDQEKAITEARKEAAKATAAEYEAKIRRSEVRSALRLAGITNEKTLTLAVNAPEFASLKVEDDGSVTEIEKTVESFKKDYPEMFAKAAAAAAGVTRGAQSSGEGERPKTLTDALTARIGARA